MASSREARVGVCCAWAIRGSFRWGIGWPSLYRQSTQHTSSGRSNVAPAVEAGEKPNILFVLTDDADSSVLPKMPQTEGQLVRKGTTLPNAFAPFATCCPSRATILRGQYPHNTGVISN